VVNEGHPTREDGFIPGHLHEDDGGYREIENGKETISAPPPTIGNVHLSGTRASVRSFRCRWSWSWVD